MPAYLTPSPLDAALLLAAVLYGTLLWRRPGAWLPCVLVALPVLDFAPWTGRLYFDEFDAMVLLTAALLWRRRGWPDWRGALPRPALWLGGLTLLSALLATLRGAYPFPALDANAWSSYDSPYNALRVAKGLWLALLLLPWLLQELRQDAACAYRRIAAGMSLGAFAATLGVCWERLCLPGLWNFHSGYRVAGLFSGMHTGGAYVEAYFATALPFVLWWTMRSRARLCKLVGASAFLLGCYAMLVTYARGGYLALLAACAVLLLGAWLWRAKEPWHQDRWAAFAVVVLLAAGTWFALNDTPMHRRAATAERDFAIRSGHWRHVLGIMDSDARARLFGMGLGQLPRLYAQRAPGGRPAAFHFGEEGGRSFLRLSGGDPLYVEQIVDLGSANNYLLEVSLRGSAAQAALHFALCRKWMLYSGECLWLTAHPKPGPDWTRYDALINAHALRPRPWYAKPTLKLSLLNVDAGTEVDVASVSLKSEDGKQVIANGNFAQGLAHWFFSADDHLPWHFKNLELQIFFEQGWLGLSLFAALLAYTAVTLVRRARREVGFPGAVLAAALTAFLTVGLVDSLFDFPRMSLLYYWMLACVHLRATPVAALAVAPAAGKPATSALQ